MTLLIISPDFASHYFPLSVLARAGRAGGHRVVVATGHELRARVEADGFQWERLILGAGSNSGTAAVDPSMAAFLAATRVGPLATLHHQARARAHDLLWRPKAVAEQVAQLHTRLQPDTVVVDHVSFGSTLGAYATGQPFITLVPGHPSQLPVGSERYGIPPHWPARLRPDPVALAELEAVTDHVTASFTDVWNAALAAVAPDRPSVADAFRVHGHRVLYHGSRRHHHPHRCADLPPDHRFVGPLLRLEAPPDHLHPWFEADDGRPRVYVALGTFLSHRSDVLARIAEALRPTGARVALAVGATPVAALGPLPDHWLVGRHLPQIALLSVADLAITHGGNNSVQEALAAGTRQLVLPFSTDQFATAADLERTGMATVRSPNDTGPAELADIIMASLAQPRPEPITPAAPEDLLDALVA